MSVFGASVAQSIAGLNQARQTSAANRKARADAPGPRPRDSDELILDVHTVQAPDAIKSAKGNADEETNEDRQGHDHYQPVKRAVDPKRPRLDVSG